MLRLATLSSVLALVGCADQGDEGMIVLNNTAITGACSLTGDPGQPFIAHGEIYARGSRGYFLTPLIQSRLASAEGADTTQKTIYLTGANVNLEVKAVSIEKPDGSFTNPSVALSGMQAQFSALFSASLPPSGSVNVGFDIIPVQTMRTILTSSGAAAEDKMIAEVLATVTVLGKLGQDEIEALPFQFPVSVCSNCVVVDNGTCPMTITQPRTGNACNVFQDGVVDCCRDASNNLICPGTTL